MSLRFPYKLLRARHAVLVLGGRWVRPRPLLAVTVIGPSDSRLKMALVDTAADDSVFSEALAAQIGIDLRKAPVGAGAGAGLAGVPLRYAQVTLRLTDGKERREWPAWVGFTAVPVLYAMLGFAGFLQFFTATFPGEREVLELAVNNLYPGT